MILFKEDSHTNPVNAALPLTSEWRSILSSNTVEALNIAHRTVKKKSFIPTEDKILKGINEHTPDNVKVVVLGQDPYPTPGQAIGRAFGCGLGLSPSLRMIYICLETYYGEKERDLKLDYLVKQGVMLINSAFTISKIANDTSHYYIWEEFTVAFLKDLVRYNRDIVLIGWGESAKKVLNKVKHPYTEVDEHPAAAVRRNDEWLTPTFQDANNILRRLDKKIISW